MIFLFLIIVNHKPDIIYSNSESTERIIYKIFELLNFQFALTRDLKIIGFNVELGGTIPQREVEDLKTGDHSMLNPDLVYPMFTLSSLVAIDLQTGRWEVLDRVIAPLSNTSIIKFLATII